MTHKILSVRIEKVRGFQPPWRPVQVITCTCGRVTRWNPSGWLGFRRTPAGHLVGITPVFPGICASNHGAYTGEVMV